jgi:hypothetical protein
MPFCPATNNLGEATVGLISMIMGHWCHISACTTHDHGMDTPSGVYRNALFGAKFHDNQGVLGERKTVLGVNDP